MNVVRHGRTLPILLGLVVATAVGMLAEAYAQTNETDGSDPSVAAADGVSIAAVPSTELSADDSVIQNSEMMPRATHSLILDIAEARDRAVAVGERGHILVSESRHDWRQIENVPTRSTLTAVAAFADQVWAVGHDGVILHSADGGLTWARQRIAPFDPADVDNLRNGAPLLDVLFVDELHGFVVGAYSQLLVTVDGGQTWEMRNVLGKSDAEINAEQSQDNSVVNDDTGTLDQDALALEEESDPHFNAIARTGDGAFFIVAERGSAFRSSDDGVSWQRIQLPYQGSMFGVLAFEAKHVLCFGLRGNVYESYDLGDQWHKLETGTNLSLMGGNTFDDGGVILVGANGIVLKRTSASADFQSSVHPDGNVLASVIALSTAEFAMAGETGMSIYSN